MSEIVVAAIIAAIPTTIGSWAALRAATASRDAARAAERAVAVHEVVVPILEKVATTPLPLRGINLGGDE